MAGNANEDDSGAGGGVEVEAVRGGGAGYRSWKCPGLFGWAAALIVYTVPDIRDRPREFGKFFLYGFLGNSQQFICDVTP